MHLVTYVGYASSLSNRKFVKEELSALFVNKANQNGGYRPPEDQPVMFFKVTSLIGHPTADCMSGS